MKKILEEDVYKNLPQSFLERIDRIVPGRLIEQYLSSLISERPMTFRTNTLKISTVELKNKLDRIGIKFEVIEWYSDAFVLISDEKELMDSYIYKEGLIYVQSLSSMIPPLILDPKRGERICDLAAAPGSKTSQIAAMMENQGELIANDISYTRLFRLRANLKLLGVENAKVFQWAGQLFWKKYPEYFDKTLLDAPCSLEGRFNANDPKSYKDWTPKKVKVLSQMQKFLLRSAISLTKVGGEIVYSTCTLSPEENEEVVDWILKREKGNIELLEIGFSSDGMLDGIVEYEGKKYNPEVKKTIRIVPNELMEGFFVAKFKKTKSNLHL